MALIPKDDAPVYAWAEITSLLRFYFTDSDPEWDAYFLLLNSTEAQRLLTVADTCTLGMPAPPALTTADFQSGDYVDILWEYATAQFVYMYCQEEP